VYLRKVAYQLGVRVKSHVPCFHKSHLQNLAPMVVRIAYSESVSLPKAARVVPYKRIQIESRVERFERLLQCEKLIPLDALKPVARKVLKSLHRNGRGEIRAAMDRTMINDTINLLFITMTRCSGRFFVMHRSNRAYIESSFRVLNDAPSGDAARVHLIEALGDGDQALEQLEEQLNQALHVHRAGPR
jgi:hypothetical protein